MDDKISLLISQLGDNRIKCDSDISEHLQTGLGGKVPAFYIATTTAELIKSIKLCRELKLEFLIFGSGSKMAIADLGVKGLVIRNRSDNLKIFGVKGKVSRLGLGIEEAFLEADSGVSLIKLAEFASDQGLGGLEGLRSTPGTVGGSLYINPLLKEKVNQVKILAPSNTIKQKSYFDLKREDIILSVVFKLKAKTVS
ncbi:FAD-binding protein [Candidatus Daviesbacteria bacterium]|nr:FAD-binding protein [Candidatus Daviesbacteria bacterium]